MPGWTAIFLFNTDTKNVHGVFTAVSAAGLNLVPEAFAVKRAGGGDGAPVRPKPCPFPVQVRVRAIHRFPAVPMRVLEPFHANLPDWRTVKHASKHGLLHVLEALDAMHAHVLGKRPTKKGLGNGVGGAGPVSVAGVAPGVGARTTSGTVIIYDARGVPSKLKTKGGGDGVGGGRMNPAKGARGKGWNSKAPPSPNVRSSTVTGKSRATPMSPPRGGKASQRSKLPAQSPKKPKSAGAAPVPAAAVATEWEDEVPLSKPARSSGAGVGVGVGVGVGAGAGAGGRSGSQLTTPPPPPLPGSSLVQQLPLSSFSPHSGALSQLHGAASSAAAAVPPSGLTPMMTSPWSGVSRAGVGSGAGVGTSQPPLPPPLPTGSSVHDVPRTFPGLHAPPRPKPMGSGLSVAAKPFEPVSSSESNGDTGGLSP